MSVILFFDDQRLINRQGCRRIYGQPEWLPDLTYRDPNLCIAGGFPSVYRVHDHLWYLYYQGWVPDQPYEVYLMMAESTDGLHWQPLDTGSQLDLPDRAYPGQFLPHAGIDEYARCFVDEAAPANERVKALIIRYDREHFRVINRLFISADGLHFIEKADVRWHTEGAEPGSGVAWNPVRQAYTLTVRPDWGERRICVSETKDWQHFTPPELAVPVDSLDEPLTETYGLPIFHYEDWTIGFLWLYHAPAGTNNNKYWYGHVDAQLVYSLNGWHFQRSLRQPFFGSLPTTHPAYGCHYPNELLQTGDGWIYILSSASTREHGFFSSDPASSAILVHRLRQDGFIALESTGGEAVICTRPLLWQGGPLELNIECPQGAATCAVLNEQGQPLAGFTHDACRIAAADSIRAEVGWQEQDMSSLVGRPVMLEVRWTAGRLYALRGDFQPLNFNQVQRYLHLGEPCNRRGF